MSIYGPKPQFVLPKTKENEILRNAAELIKQSQSSNDPVTDADR